MLGRYRLAEPAAATGTAHLETDPVEAARSGRTDATIPRFRYASVSLEPGALSVAVRERS